MPGPRPYRDEAASDNPHPGPSSCATGPPRFFFVEDAANQCLWLWGPEWEGLAPQMSTQFESLIVRGSKPTWDSPYNNASAAWPAALQMLSGSTSDAPSFQEKAHRE